MQQALSFVGLPLPAPATAQQTPVTAVAGAPPGLFQQLLLGAMQGAGPGPEAPLPAQPVLRVQGQAVPAQVPGVPVDLAALALAGKLSGEPVTAGQQAPVPQAQVPQAPVPQAQVPQAQVPLAPVPQAPIPQAPVPQAPVPAESVQAAPTAHAPVLELGVPEAPAPAAEDSAPVPIPEPAQPDGAAVAQMMAATGAAAQPLIQPQVQQQVKPPPSEQPRSTSPEPAALTFTPEAETDPVVERFVQRAVQQAVQPREGQAQLGQTSQKAPTFADLVNLVRQAEQQPGRPDVQQVQQAPERLVRAAETLRSEPAELPVVAEPRFQQTLTETPFTAEAPAPERPSVDAESVMRQVVRSVKVALDGKRSEVSLQLNPEHLGKLAVRLILNEGTVQASITARDASVRAALEANLEQLKSRFAEQGLRVDQVHIAVGGDQNPGQFHHAPQHQHRQQEQGGAQQPWQRRQEAQQQQESRPPQPRPSPRMWAYGHTGARINSLA